MTMANWVQYLLRPPTLSDQNEILHGTWPSEGSSKVLIFGAVGVKICPFSSIWALVYTKSFTVSQQIKEVIGNGHEKLNKLMIAQTWYLLPAKITKIGSSVLKL